jgi:hypothetical protein
VSGARYFTSPTEGTKAVTGDQSTIPEVMTGDELFGRWFRGPSWLPSHRNDWDALGVSEPSGIHWQIVFFVITDRCLTDTSASSGVLFSGSCLACVG